MDSQTQHSLAQHIKTVNAEWPLRFEVYDPFVETTYRFPTAQEAIVKADDLGASRFQYREADETVKQVDKVDGQWWVRNLPLRMQDHQHPPYPEDKPLAAVQEKIEMDALIDIESRAARRAAIGQRFDATINYLGYDIKADKMMASVDAFAFRRIQDPVLQKNAATVIAKTARQFPDYKDGLDKAIPGYPGTAAKIYALDASQKAQQEPVSAKAVTPRTSPEHPRSAAARFLAAHSNDAAKCLKNFPALKNALKTLEKMDRTCRALGFNDDKRREVMGKTKACVISLVEKGQPLNNWRQSYKPLKAHTQETELVR